MKDRAAMIKQQEENRRRFQQAQEAEIDRRYLNTEARRLGRPSPRMRAASAGPLVAKQGPSESETKVVQVWHRVPSMDPSHRLSAGCFCGPVESPRERDGTRWFLHNVNATWEITGDDGVTATRELLQDRER